MATVFTFLVFGLIGLVAVLSALWGVGYAVFIAFAFVKAIVDRANDKESAYYSKHVDK